MFPFTSLIDVFRVYGGWSYCEYLLVLRYRNAQEWRLVKQVDRVMVFTYYEVLLYSYIDVYVQ